MDEKAYTQAIMSILQEGLGFRAIKDLTQGLERYQGNMNMLLSEMKAEKKTVMKICDSKISNKEKLRAVMSLWTI